jgi:hypothetical protein
MTQRIYQLIVVLLFILSIFGWGRLARRFLDRRVFIFHSLTAIVGMAVLGLIGGLLNLAHLATTRVLLVLMLIGVGVALREILRWRPWQRRTFPLESIPLFVAPAIALCAALLLMPTTLFNFVDDFHTYVTRAMRMAQTGTLAGNAFDSLGTDSLGSASFFHGFFLAAGGVEFLNGFDAVAGFALCLLVVAELSLRWRMPWWLGLSILFTLAWFNPQSVNISPLYSGAAGVMALTLCGILLARTLTRKHVASAWRIALTLGLLAAWLATMKITLGLFAAIFLVALFLVLVAAGTNRRAVFKNAVIAGATSFLGVLPWVLVAMPALLKARGTATDFIASAPMADKYPSLAAHEWPLLFQPMRLYYGNTPLLYLGISTISLALGISGLAHWIRSRPGGKLSGMAAVASASVAMTAILFLNGHLFYIADAVRYSCPILIGGVAAVALGFLRSRTAAASRSRHWLGGALATGAVSLVVLFNGTFVERLNKAMHDHTLIAFPYDGDYASYCKDMIKRDQTAYHRQLQSRIPAAATVLVWTATPFHFDFERNHLLTTSVGGLCSPALHFPAGLPPRELEQYFRNNGVQFVLIETKGYGVAELNDLAKLKRKRQPLFQKLGDFGTYLRLGIDDLAARGRTIYEDERMLLFELRPADQSEVVARAPSPDL